MSEWKKASEVLPASNETVVFLDKGGELDVGHFFDRTFSGSNGVRYAIGVDYWMSIPALPTKPLTKTEALREAITRLERIINSCREGCHHSNILEAAVDGMEALPRLRAALESED